MKKNLHGILLFILLPFLFSFTPAGDKPLKIALTKASPNYNNWLAKGDSSVIIIDLYNLDPKEASLKLQECSGLLLTGGGDIDPSFYKSEGNKDDCRDIDLRRDKLEKAMIDEALLLKMPVLGICRGEQMLNVALGGSLITDIPAFLKAKSEVPKSSVTGANTGVEQPVLMNDGSGIKNVIHQCDDYMHCYHSVRLDPSSLLRQIIGFDTGFVTTNHHQAVFKIAKGLKTNAFTADSIIEGVEWENARGKSFMVGVQWHPERMDTSNAFSGKLLLQFLAEARKYGPVVIKAK